MIQALADPAPWPEPRPPLRQAGSSALTANLRVDLDSAAEQRELLGSGFNFEHALWSCPQFRGLFQREILDPFQPAVARVDTGLLPAAPPELSAEELGPDVYMSMLASEPYAESWRFIERLNEAGVRVVLGVWGGPNQFTREGVRRGTLDPAHYDRYVDYVATLVDFLVRREGLEIWAITIANEPDGGDGVQIPPEGLAYIGHALALRLQPLGVKLYGPDTASGGNAMAYLPLLLDDPVIAAQMAFVGFHQYHPSSEVGMVVDYVRARRPDLPVIITEYTSFKYGDLDTGLEVNDRAGVTLDVVDMLLSHYEQGVDAALYWDAVDYLQPGHTAITRWGILRGPGRDFARRTRYYGMAQVLPFLQPGARVLPGGLEGMHELRSLAVVLPGGEPAVFVVNQGPDTVDLRLDLAGSDAGRFSSLTVWRTDRTSRGEPQGRVRLQNGVGQLGIPPFSVTTLFPSGGSPDDARELD